MTDADFSRFSDWFDVLAITHRLNAREDAKSHMKAEYFDVLASYPVDAVQQSYERLRRTMKKWPVPADWLESLPPFGGVGRLPALLPSEQRDLEAAERLGFEMESGCYCAVCERAGVTHLRPRYVPLLDAYGEVIPRRHLSRNGRPALLGRWIHGQELRAWSAARAEYYALRLAFDAHLARERASRSQETVEQRAARLARVAAVTIAGENVNPRFRGE